MTGMCSYVGLVGPWLVSWRDQFETAKKTLPPRFAAATTDLRPASGFYWGLPLTAVLALVRQAVRVIPPPEQDCSDGCWSPQ